LTRVVLMRPVFLSASLERINLKNLEEDHLNSENLNESIPFHTTVLIRVNRNKNTQCNNVFNIEIFQLENYQ